MTELLQQNTIATKRLSRGFEIRNWYPGEGTKLFNDLEKKCWAPWLVAAPESLNGRSQTFARGQFVAVDKGLFVASLSTNLIYWNGHDINSLPCWDDVAGDPTTYQHTYNKHGNTLVMMSMNVHPDPQYRGSGITNSIFEFAQRTALELGVEHLVVSARPSKFGEAKMQPNAPDFTEYCQRTIDREGKILPADAWLRSLYYKGMRPLKIDFPAMTIPVTLDEFYSYMHSYNLGLWSQVSENVWECGEVGQWEVIPQRNQAVYREANFYMKYQQPII